MKKLSTIIAILMAAIMATLLPVQVFADARPEYISEIKIGMGKDAAEAKEALDGYTILDADLNQNAGGGWGSKGEKAVYLGYKTTTDKNDAITDLALMNMKGGYDVAEYEALMKTQMKQQIIPFVDSFLAALEEYRENYNSDIEENQQRAQNAHDKLNKLTDDDCGGAGLGDLLLNETKYEMGDDAYNKLSDAEKKKHADILTILAQANGQATVIMETLITSATDTEEDTWIDRFSELTYDDLLASYDALPTDAKKLANKDYYNDAVRILDKWDDFRTALEEYEENMKVVEDSEIIDSINENSEKLENFDEKNATDEELADAAISAVKTRSDVLEYSESAGDAAAKEYLETIDYEDGTLLDFFMKDTEEVRDNIEILFPLVASLSDGQKAGLDFISLKDLVLMTQVDEQTNKESNIEQMDPTSIYEGVDRAIYQKGGVALTSDALRAKADEIVDEDQSVLSTFTYVMIGLTAASAVGFIASLVAKKVIYLKTSVLANEVYEAKKAMTIAEIKFNYAFDGMCNLYNDHRKASNIFSKASAELSEKEKIYEGLRADLCASRKNVPTFSKMAIGFSVAMVILSAVTVYLSYLDMVKYYNVEFTPIPHYMVDEKDITAYNANGEKIVIKNQSAYYKAVPCNRTNDAEYYDNLGTCSDLNGDVGKQWLALYSVKNNAEDPIIASSLKAVVGDDNIPTGYETGIHMFGSDSAYNLNNAKFVWNKSAKSVYVYFNRDENANASTAGSGFSAGTLALSGGLGLALGVVLSAVAMTAKNKKREKQTLATD